jgi:hypothetical protein
MSTVDWVHAGLLTHPALIKTLEVAISVVHAVLATVLVCEWMFILWSMHVFIAASQPSVQSLACDGPAVVVHLWVSARPVDASPVLQ